MRIDVIPRMRFHTALVFALLLSIPLHAHHSGVMFDPMKEVTLKGTVKEFVFANPHVSIVIAAVDDKGQVVDWSIEAASTQSLVRSGWRKSSLKFGDVVTIVGRPLRDGRPGAQLVRVILADGTELGRGGPNF
jgi:hypothetical protein